MCVVLYGSAGNAGNAGSTGNAGNAGNVGNAGSAGNAGNASSRQYVQNSVSMILGVQWGVICFQRASCSKDFVCATRLIHRSGCNKALLVSTLMSQHQLYTACTSNIVLQYH